MSAPASFVLREANVLDEAGGFAGPLDVKVEHGVVVAVGRNLPASAEASFDFSGLWLVPGFFDCHNHVTMSTFDLAELLARPISAWALEAARNARVTLEAGVTFVRDLAGADSGMRHALATGVVPGPRLQISVVMIGQTGGHADGFLPGVGLEIAAGYLIPDYPGRPPFLVDGPESMRHTVREVIRAGADWIKLATSGGLVSEHDDPHAGELTLEEIGVAVEEASRRGKGVATHALGGEGIDNAVEAGVRSIEHGHLLTEEQAARMAEKGCWLVPTLSPLRDCLRWAQDGVLTPAQCRKVLGFGIDLGAQIPIAKAAGVPIAMGADYISRTQHGGNLEELALMCDAGLTPEEALLAGTWNGAQLCGVADRYGRIAPGYVFDAAVLDEDPGDLSLFRKPGAVRAVFKDGLPVVPHERLQASHDPAAREPAVEGELRVGT